MSCKVITAGTIRPTRPFMKPPAELAVFWTVREDPRKLAEKCYILQTGDPEKRGEEVQPGFRLRLRNSTSPLAGGRRF